jgi:carbamoyltransferase
MKVLGLCTDSDSGAAIVEDGHIVAAVSEERLSRMKLVVGFPRNSISEVLRLSGATIGELDAVLVGSYSQIFRDRLEPFDGWFEHSLKGAGGLVKRIAGKLSPYRRQLPILEWGYYALSAPRYRRGRLAVERVLRKDFDVTCPVTFVDHHLAHVATAYFTSGFDDALVISADGGGDRRSSVVYAVRNGRYEQLGESSAYDSLGNYYGYVTHLCGFKAWKHEGKITGLAAYGEPKYVELLREFVDEESGQFVNRAEVVFLEAVRELQRRLPQGWNREDLAASIQRHFEEVTQRYIRYWAKRANLADVALAGGVFANVRVNQAIHEIPEVERVFVHPHMGDGGVGVGAALAACVRRAAVTPEVLEMPLEEHIAELLVKGHVVARAEGRMEYGPRALGNRSVLYHPTDRDVNDWLNEKLRRTEFMPFAPAALYEERAALFEGVSGAEHTAQFMTITFDCTPRMKQCMEGVVHVDGTARPHLVLRDRNPSMYQVIEAFHERTGLPAIINTSFNMHEEPIVCSADDCVRAFLDAELDYLAIGPHLVKNPRGITRPLKACNAVIRQRARV